MSYIGNSPGVASQRVVTEEVVSGSPKTDFYPVGGYTLGYVDVLVNGLEVDSTDFTAADGVKVSLATAAAVGDTVKIKCFMPRGLSDGYLKAEADARYPRVDTASQGLNSTQQGNARTNINAQAALGYTPVNKAGDTLTGALYVGTPSRGDGGTNSLAPLVASGPATDTISTRMVNNTSIFRVWASNANNGLQFGVGLGGLTYDPWIQAAYDNSANTSTDGSGIKNLRLNPLGGDVSIGNGNLVLANGKGIDFSAHSNASGMTSELFDDYETGSWTPSFAAVNGDHSISYTTQFGSYVKIGRLVFAKGYMLINTITNRGTGGMALAGLPFSVTEEVNLNFSDNNALTNYYSASLTQIYGYGAAGTGMVHFRAAGGSNSLYRPIPNAPLQAGYLLFNVTYIS